jgi:hypothetical protein
MMEVGSQFLKCNTNKLSTDQISTPMETILRKNSINPMNQYLGPLPTMVLSTKLNT